MEISIPAGKYVVAVSGGVDSVVLLDLLHKLPNAELVVAHYDHGIRPNSREDAMFVQALAERYGLEYVGGEGNLGATASEQKAREARYAFLRGVQKHTQARALITAHHQDDVLETAIMNILRGTGRKGLASLNSTETILRPLLDIPKFDILTYAKRHTLQWQEDSTNTDSRYFRNYIRLHIVPRLTLSDRQQFLRIVNHTRQLNRDLDALLSEELNQQRAQRIDRNRFTNLPHDVSIELMAAWLRENNLREFDTKMLDRLTVAAKTGRPGTVVNVYKNVNLRISKKDLALDTFER